MSSSTIGVLTVTQDPQAAQAVADAVRLADSSSPHTVCRTIDDVVLTLDRTQAAAVVVDIDPKPAHMLADLEPIINRAIGTRFIVICSEFRNDLMMHAMQVGVRHFILKDKIKADLVPVLQRLAPSANVTRNGWHGSIVTILSAGGGCGATTFGINLANELHLLSSKPTLLIDLDCVYGSAAGYLGVTAQYGIADVLTDGDRIDAQLIRSTAVAHSDHLHLLASPATVNFEDPAPMAYQHLSRALQKGRETYAYTVVDAPSVPIQVATLLAAASAMTYIVLEMNVENIRVARALFMAIAGRGIPQDRILPLVNRYRGRREMISIEDAQRAIGSERIGTLSNDYKGVLSSINFGKPLADAAPRSALRVDIQNLAKSVAQASVSVRQLSAVR